TRVETIRRLSLMAGPAAAPGSSGVNVRLLALAASLVAIAGAGVWIAFSQSRGPEPAAPPVASPHATVFAFAVSPMTVRGNAETPALTVPPGIDLVELQFEASGNARPLDRGRVVIRTVAGADVWQGPIASSAGLPSGIIAAVEIPADRLRADDY